MVMTIAGKTLRSAAVLVLHTSPNGGDLVRLTVPGNELCAVGE